MKFNRRHIIGAAAAATATASASALFAATRPPGQPGGRLPHRPAAEPKLDEQPSLLRQAIAALDSHGSKIPRRDRIGIVDFAAHSSKKRFQIVDIPSGTIAGSYLVAHGRGSDPAHSGWAETFSNRHGSNASSRGSFLLSNDYYGKHGHSRRLIGLDPENDQAFPRAIVMHGANYVDPGLIDSQGKIGRSLGCFSVTEQMIEQVLRELGDGHLLFASA